MRSNFRTRKTPYGTISGEPEEDEEDLIFEEVTQKKFDELENIKPIQLEKPIEISFVDYKNEGFSFGLLGENSPLFSILNLFSL